MHRRRKLLREGGVDAKYPLGHSKWRAARSRGFRWRTINVAEAFYLQRDMGAVAPGRYADILLVDDLATFDITRVFVGGKTVVLDGEFSGGI